MNPDTIKNSIQAVIDGLTPLAQKLQIPIEGVFKWAIKHNYALAFSQLLTPLICIIIFAIISVKMIKLGTKNDNTGYVGWVS